MYYIVRNANTSNRKTTEGYIGVLHGQLWQSLQSYFRTYDKRLEQLTYCGALENISLVLET